MAATLEKPKPNARGAKTVPQPWKWTREQYYELHNSGYFREMRVELIEGEIVIMPAVNLPHTVAIKVTERKLETCFGPNFWVRIQDPLNFSTSMPQPDLAVVPGDPRDYTDHPTTALLVIEVADTTLSYDSGRKAMIYANAGIADYWVLDLKGQKLIVFRKPSKTGYKEKTIFKRTDYATALALPQVPIKVSELLP